MNKQEKNLAPLVLAALLTTLGCSGHPAGRPTSTATTTQAKPRPAEIRPAPVVLKTEPPVETNDMDGFVAQLEGAWAGRDNKTPFGPIPFALIFDREPDGAFHAHTANGPGFYIDLRVRKDDAGRWMFDSEAAIPQMGMNRHTLEPASGSGHVMVWKDVEKPEYLQIQVELTHAAMIFKVILRGEEHVRFNLARLEGRDARRLREQLESMRRGPTGNAIPGPSRTELPSRTSTGSR